MTDLFSFFLSVSILFNVATLTAQSLGEQKADGKLVLENQGLLSDEPITIVEKMPRFQGGTLLDFRNWVQARIRLPEEALKDGFYGRVILEFFIDRDGNLTNVKVLNSPLQALSDEAVRVVSSSPKWEPGMQRWNCVNVKFTLPIVFKKEGAIYLDTEIPEGVSYTPPLYKGKSVEKYYSSLTKRLSRKHIRNSVADERIVVTFVITETGDITDVIVVESQGEDLDMDIANIMFRSCRTGSWLPAKFNGSPVNIKMLFVLSKE